MSEPLYEVSEFDAITFMHDLPEIIQIIFRKDLKSRGITLPKGEGSTEKYIQIHQDRYIDLLCHDAGNEQGLDMGYLEELAYHEEIERSEELAYKEYMERSSQSPDSSSEDSLPRPGFYAEQSRQVA
jgi:hypothetical protein